MKHSLSMARMLMLILIVALSFVGQAQASGGGHGSRELVEGVDGYKVTLAFEAGASQIGHNELIVQLHDAQGQPVGNAKVTVVAQNSTGPEKDAGGQSSKDTATDMGMSMGTESKAGSGETDPPGSPGTVELAAGHEIGEYVGEVEMLEAGNWTIKVVFAVQQQEKSVAFAMDLKKGGPSWPVLWSFLGVNVALIAIAGITRKKSVLVMGRIQEEVA